MKSLFGKRPFGSSIIIIGPMLWLFMFFLLPFVFLFGLSFSEIEISRPPYTQVFTFEDGYLSIVANMGNWVRLATDNSYFTTYLSSIWIAFGATICTLTIGFPMAYMIARAKGTRRSFLLLLVILPFWTSFLLRVYALKTIFYNQGPINALLLALGVVDSPVQFLNSDFAVYVGITYTYLPFMVLPLYANLEKLQDDMIEASQDLGASRFATFWQVIVPLALPGIVAGSLLVFIPAVGEYVIPDMLGGPATKMIGKLIYVEYFNNRDWPMAATLAVSMLVLIVLPFTMLRRWQMSLKA